MDDVLDFWFGNCGPAGVASGETKARWYKKDPGFDSDIRERFLEIYEQLVSGQLQSWLQDARGALAAIIVLDQFSRNMFRDQARMYAADKLAQAIAHQMVENGWDKKLPGHLRCFVYMPFMHAEDKASQAQCQALFEGYLSECEQSQPEMKESVASYRGYAIAHRKIVDRFGHFPHRNEIIGRRTTSEEAAFLKEKGSSF